MNYHWDKFLDHNWLSVDKDGHVAVVECAVGHRLPCWIDIDGSLLDGLYDRILEYLANKNPSLSDRIRKAGCSPQGDDILRECGFFVLDFPYSSGGRLIHYDYIRRPSYPIAINSLPRTLSYIATKFALPSCSFLNGDLIGYRDWKDCSDDVARSPGSIVFLQNRIELVMACSPAIRIPLRHHDADIPRELSTRLQISFLPNSCYSDETAFSGPHIVDWSKYGMAFSSIIHILKEDTGATRIEKCGARPDLPVTLYCKTDQVTSCVMILNSAPIGLYVEGVSEVGCSIGIIESGEQVRVVGFSPESFSFVVFCRDGDAPAICSHILEACAKLGIGFDLECPRAPTFREKIWKRLSIAFAILFGTSTNRIRNRS